MNEINDNNLEQHRQNQRDANVFPSQDKRDFEQEVDDMGLGELFVQADKLGVDHWEKEWFDDEFEEREDEFRLAVLEAMKDEN